MAYQDHEDGGRSGHKMSSGNSCQRCSHGDAHYYWHHLDDRKKHFFKVMLGDFQQEMIVPEKFVNNFRGQIAETVKLEAPDGNMYNVQVFKDLNKLVFRSGWGTFCNAYQLKLGDVLVFRYSGDSHFKVLIFDPSGCEKVFFGIVMNSGYFVEQQGVPHEKLWATERFTQHRTGGPSHTRKASKMTPSDSPSQRSSVAVSEDIPSPENIQDPSNSGGLQQTSSESRFIIANGCNLSRAQRDSIDALERKIRPEIPMYVTHINKTGMSDRFLLICKDYSDKHLPNEDQTITLCYPPDYEKHDANFKVSPAGAYIFSANWSLFVRDNEVQEGDAFAFEALKIERRVTLTVHPLQGSYQGDKLKPQTCTLKAVQEHTCSVHVKFMFAELGASSPNRVVRPAYMVTRKTKLTPEQKKKVEEKLQEIQPATPVFLSVKRHSDASMVSNSTVSSVQYFGFSI
ncbi:hypothetical protein PR202_ga12007 [Eleusine coracana subsp. coracana]|uniref:TF-B3 domain-containing protein n=1 Tax=Eleusine coracana subsp. coracana TaxID=191504 RepID=A0AAV5CAF0_ELECO|nr:hypothetical protein PR202_ga12007 [Eleusine coracana subsp. coracana]